MLVTNDMQKYYSRRAPEYEGIYQKPERQTDLAILREQVPELLADTSVLEIACGTAYWTAIIAGAARTILASDYSAEVLEIARNKQYPADRVRFQIADAYDLSGMPGGFTAGFAGFWWSHVPRERLSAFLRGFHAKLVPGARVLFLDNRYVEGSSTPISREDAAGNTFQLRHLSDGTTHEVLKNFPTGNELRAVVAPLAEEVTVTELQYFWMISYRVVALGDTGEQP